MLIADGSVSKVVANAIAGGSFEVFWVSFAVADVIWFTKISSFFGSPPSSTGRSNQTSVSKKFSFKSFLILMPRLKELSPFLWKRYGLCTTNHLVFILTPLVFIKATKRLLHLRYLAKRKNIKIIWFQIKMFQECVL